MINPINLWRKKTPVLHSENLPRFNDVDGQSTAIPLRPRNVYTGDMPLRNRVEKDPRKYPSFWPKSANEIDKGRRKEFSHMTWMGLMEWIFSWILVFGIVAAFAYGLYVLIEKRHILGRGSMARDNYSNGKETNPWWETFLNIQS